jgi:hypothetical protein
MLFWTKNFPVFSKSSFNSFSYLFKSFVLKINNLYKTPLKDAKIKNIFIFQKYTIL